MSEPIVIPDEPRDIDESVRTVNRCVFKEKISFNFCLFVCLLTSVFRFTLYVYPFFLFLVIDFALFTCFFVRSCFLVTPNSAPTSDQL